MSLFRCWLFAMSVCIVLGVKITLVSVMGTGVQVVPTFCEAGFPSIFVTITIGHQELLFHWIVDPSSVLLMHKKSRLANPGIDIEIILISTMIHTYDLNLAQRLQPRLGTLLTLLDQCRHSLEPIPRPKKVSTSRLPSPSTTPKPHPAHLIPSSNKTKQKRKREKLDSKLYVLRNARIPHTLIQPTLTRRHDRPFPRQPPQRNGHLFAITTTHAVRQHIDFVALRQQVERRLRDADVGFDTHDDDFPRS